jgi:hypothetical protein
MNLQVIGGPDGEILWVSGALPGAVHDLTAARIWGIVRRPAAAGLIVLADKGPPRKRPPTAPTPCCAPQASGQRPAQDLAHPAQDALPPLARRETRQGHPRSSNLRDHRMKNAHWPE